MELPREEIPKDDNLLPCTKPKNSFFQSFSPPAKTEMSSDIFNVDFTAQQTENLSETVKSKTSAAGGFICCVRLCYNNSKRNKDLSFYVIPKDNKLRKIWLSKISRKNFTPTSGHRVCSAHFKDGKKTYMNNVPTIVVPKSIGATPTKKRTRINSLGLKRKLSSPIKPKEPELTNEEKLRRCFLPFEYVKYYFGLANPIFRAFTQGNGI